MTQSKVNYLNKFGDKCEVYGNLTIEGDYYYVEAFGRDVPLKVHKDNIENTININLNK